MSTKSKKKTIPEEEAKIELPAPEIIYRLLMARSAQIKSMDIREYPPTENPLGKPKKS